MNGKCGNFKEADTIRNQMIPGNLALIIDLIQLKRTALEGK